jgi:hypothetical protein
MLSTVSLKQAGAKAWWMQDRQESGDLRWESTGLGGDGPGHRVGDGVFEPVGPGLGRGDQPRRVDQRPLLSTSLLPETKSASEVSATDSTSVPEPGAAVPSVAVAALEAAGVVAWPG